MTSTSPSRRVERKERLRGEILAAASKMFADRGYEAVTLRAIAKEIGYTHAVIYQHFPDKWHILAELSSETIGLLVQNFDAIAAKHLAPKERLFATSRGLIQFCTAHPQQFRNVFFGPENRNGVRAGEYINDIGAPLFGRFVQLFFDVARDEGLPSSDIVVAHTWWFTIFGLATLMVIQGAVPGLTDQTLVVEQTIATLWAGVQVVPRLPKSAISKRSGRPSASK
ncbi:MULTISPECIES: TetR/AcrR family transcriptional regulator [Acidobacteriaceae]|uniref:TetR/AcrR family transcriptional regulator n=1 Tax=Acidobacteriaceae TaxID=204434 RepID=UPI00210F2EFC|nr:MULTISPECIES: TetR/AcrR family transcriptional regulator [Acidobacteriaceae]MDW5266249.1 TetR/AcrR family transcriptional regulator [Edaphobacter sp.]